PARWEIRGDLSFRSVGEPPSNRIVADRLVSTSECSATTWRRSCGDRGIDLQRKLLMAWTTWQTPQRSGQTERREGPDAQAGPHRQDVLGLVVLNRGSLPPPPGPALAM